MPTPSPKPSPPLSETDRLLHQIGADVAALRAVTGLAPLAQAVADATEIDPILVEDAFARLPRDIAHWNNQYADQLRRYLTAEFHVKQLKALLAIEHRQKLADALGPSGRVTESQVDAAVQGDKRLKAAHDNLVEQEVEKVRLQGVCEALRAKQSALMSIGASIRAEKAGDPTIRDRDSGARSHSRG